MLEAIESANVSKEEYAERVPGLRVELLNAQFDFQDAGFSVLVLIAGDDSPSIDEVVELLHEWMDARHIRTRFFGAPTAEELERPRLWRYWRELPGKGETGLLLGAWAHRAIGDRLLGRTDGKEFERRAGHNRGFEEELAANGTLVLKFWMHLSKKDRKKKLKKARKDPERAATIEAVDREIYERYDEVIPIVARYLQRTDSESAPWHIVDSGRPRVRNLFVAQTILRALDARLETESATGKNAGKSVTSAPLDLTTGALHAIDLSVELDKDDYRKRLEKLQTRMWHLSRRARSEGLSTVLVFEGWDAAGKGGTIRRITGAMSARDYTVVPVAAPTDEEKSHHYLWRFWRKLRRRGSTLIFDRSWYGRVLVERVEGLAREDEWRRAYGEINDFEEQLTDHGMPVLKFWLHLDPDEQLRRFKEREKTAYKKYKITGEDYRNREKWDEYVVAINEMVTRTDTPAAPWFLVAANDKRWARISVLETVCERLEHALDSASPKKKKKKKKKRK